MKKEICVVCGIFEREKKSNKCCSCNDCAKHFIKQNLDGIKNKPILIKVMNPKEKAKDLIHNIQWNTLISKIKAKKCALITINEIIQIIEKEDENYNLIGILDYWIEVIKELEKL